MNPSLRQLQVLVHVHRAGNLTRAATQLGLSQAAVSLQLQQLEKVFSAGFASTFMPAILGVFRKDHPGVDVVFYDVPAHQLVDRLLTTDAEIAIGSVQGEIPDVTIERILKGRISAIGPARGALG